MSHKLEIQNIEASHSSQPTSTVTEKQMSIKDLKKNLSIYPFKNDLIQAIQQNQVLIVEGQTRVGKTTQIPQYLKEAGFCNENMRIGCTQAKRLAAIKAAIRVAQEMGVEVGDEVGYSIRFEDRTSPKTQIKYMTDGALLRELLQDPDLKSYSVIIIDEAHERSLNTDLLLTLIKDILKRRSDLKIIICVATRLDTEKISTFFDGVPVLRIPYRQSTTDTKEKEKPEIQRVNLGNAVLFLKYLGINDLNNFNFMDPPPREALDFVLEQLSALGAFNQLGELTPIGRKMAELPVDVTMSRMLIAASEKYKCSVEILSIAAMLSVNNSIFCSSKVKMVQAKTSKNNFFSLDGDHLTLLKIYNDWVNSSYSEEWCSKNFIQFKTMKMAKDIRDQFESFMERVGLEILSNPDSIAIRKAITAGYFLNVAKLFPGTGEYKNLKNGQTLRIHPNSSLFDKEPPKWIIYDKLDSTTEEFMRHVIQVERFWILEIVPNYYKAKELDL